MKMIKKILTITILSAMVLSMVACGSTDEPTSSQTSSSSVSTPDSSSEAETPDSSSEAETPDSSSEAETPADGGVTSNLIAALEAGVSSEILGYNPHFSTITDASTLMLANTLGIISPDTLTEAGISMDALHELTEEDFAKLNEVVSSQVEAYVATGSLMNMQAFGVIIAKPVAGSEEAVQAGLQTFIDLQIQNFTSYLPDQLEIAQGAKLEVMEDGTIVLVMMENADAVMSEIKANL